MTIILSFALKIKGVVGRVAHTSRRTGVGVTTVFNLLTLGRWVTKVLKNGNKKYEGRRVGDNAPAEKLE